MRTDCGDDDKELRHPLESLGSASWLNAPEVVCAKVGERERTTVVDERKWTTTVICAKVIEPKS